jgi:hypothetical protein
MIQAGLPTTWQNGVISLLVVFSIPAQLSSNNPKIASHFVANYNTFVSAPLTDFAGKQK